MAQQPIYLIKEERIAWLYIDRPDKKNALNRDMWQMLAELVIQAEHDPEVKILILRSAAENIFCAGADIGEFDLFINDREARDQNRKSIRAACQTLEDCTKPTIAMINGACVGGGCILALCCDIRYGDSTSRYGITPAKLGLVYGLSDIRRLLDLVGSAQTSDILFSGRIISAGKALQIGLINDVFPTDELENRVRDYVHPLLNNSPHSLREIKQFIRRIEAGERHDDDHSEKIFMDAFDGADHREGVKAFLNKNKPNY